MTDEGVLVVPGASSESEPPTSRETVVDTDFEEEILPEAETSVLLGSSDDIAIVADAIAQTNVLIVICIAVILACGFARALLGWCHRG